MKSINDKATRWQGGGGRPLRGGAWIEMQQKRPALTRQLSRPLRGGRGLKLHKIEAVGTGAVVAPFAGGVD